MRRVLASLAALLLAAVTAQAQYFGRNKVLYESFEFEVLKTEHFDIYFYPAERPAAHLAARLAERWYERLRTVLGHDLGGRQPILLYAGHPDFQQTTAVQGPLDEGTGGVTEFLKRRVILPFAGPLRETDHVLGHELAHAFQIDILSRKRGSAARLPLWFIEGMAEYLSLGAHDPLTDMWMRDAVREGRVPTIRELDDRRYFPYRYGHAFWMYVAERWGDEAVGKALRAATRSRGPRRALARVLRIGDDDLSRDWAAWLRAKYPSPAGASAPEAFGRLLVRRKKDDALHLAPALSPDGRRLVFLSEDRGASSLELFLADVDTGRVLRRILKQRLDPHFDSLEFVQSAGAWDPAGRLFAFAAVRKGRPVLSILDVERGSIAREESLRGLEEILNPTWSPDGRRVAFSAVRGGVTDLFVYDLEERRLEELMDDTYADLQPAWSPDGRTIAFVTDRFSARLDDLSWGAYGLARIDVATGAVEALPSLPGAKNVNPQWGRGGVLYFLSDRGGVTNVYRLDPATAAIRQVTDLAIGVSGLTALSPALTAAADADRVVVSAYAKGRHHLYAIEAPRVLAGEELKAIVPPAEPRREGTLAALLADPESGLPPLGAAHEEPYRPRFSPDRVGEPYLAVGGDRFGMFVSGGASLFWSDVLSHHNLVTALEVKGSFKDLAGLVGYHNQRHRWQWAVSAEQLAFVSGTFSSGLADRGGQTVALEQTARFREVDRRLTGVVAYPFSRTLRLELSASYRNARFSTDITTRSLSLESGATLDETRLHRPAPETLHLAELGGALVHDSARFGPTSPVRGARYRLEVLPAFGSLRQTALLADARRYVTPKRPVTLAVRALHFGRYGPDAENRRLSPLFVGYPNLVRGYDFDAFGTERCVPGGCPRIESLVGSRMLVGNVELRVPAFAFLGDGREYGPLPTEAFLFFDAGVAWTRDVKPRLFGGTRDAVRSWGAGVRVNLMGLAIGEVDYIRPLDLPGGAARWRVVLTPGF
jgi:Tol biopolymer transport system component